MTPTSGSLVQLLFWFITRCVLWLLLGCVGCLVAATLMVALAGPTGSALLHALIARDYHYIGTLAAPDTLATLHRQVQRIPDHLTLPALSWHGMPLHGATIGWLNMKPVVHAALWGLRLVWVRLNLLWHGCPLWFALFVVGLTDGLAQRDIRRRALGRESALLYHHSKSLATLFFVLGIFLVLALPITVRDTAWVFVTATLLFGVAMQMTVKRYKKYL